MNRTKKKGTPSKGSNNFGHTANKKRKNNIRDEDSGSDEEYGMSAAFSSDEEKNSQIDEQEEEDPFKNETAEERRIRLAKDYLEKIQNEGKRKRSKTEDDESDEEETGFGYEDIEADKLDKENIAHRLKQESIESKGRYQRKLARQLQNATIDEKDIRTLRGHQHSVTCVAVSNDETSIYSGSKDCNIIRWDMETGSKVAVYRGGKAKDKNVEGHHGSVLSLALSSDGRYLASGGTDKDHLLKIWDTRSNTLIDNFKGHRDHITSLAFRSGTAELFSGSSDRTIKIWNVEDMSYIDTLYGHQSEVMSVDSLLKERAISCGRDNSVRIWKVVEETQLVFRGHTSSIDCVSLINEEQFVSGSDDGSIALWTTQKKKPVATIRNAHSGLQFNNNTLPSNGHHQVNSKTPNWITSISAFKNSDLVASGSHDGFIRLWEVGKTNNPRNPSPISLKELLSIPVTGFINAITFSKTGRFLIAGIGQDHRLGRWESIKEAKNGIRIIPLPVDLDKEGQE